MISKITKFCQRKLTIGLVSLSIGFISVNSIILSPNNLFTVYANEVVSHRNDITGSSKEWGTLAGNQFIIDYTNTSFEVSKAAHSSFSENYHAIRIPETYPYKLFVNGQPKTLSDLKRDKIGHLTAVIDGREVPLLDYGMVEYQMNRYLGKDIYNIYGNLSYTAYAFLTTRTSHHGYFELTEADNVRDVSGQLVTGFFQTPEYRDMASAYHKSNSGYLKVQVGDQELSTNIVNGRLNGLKTAKQHFYLVSNSEFSMDPQTGKPMKQLRELTEDEVHQLKVTETKVNSEIEFDVNGKTYQTTGRLNFWKNSTINPLKTRLAVMSIGDGNNIHGFDLYASNNNYIEVVEKIAEEPSIPESISKMIEFVTEDGEKVSDGPSITGNKGEEVTLEITPPDGYTFVSIPPERIVLEDSNPIQIIVNENTGQETLERVEEIDYRVIRQENPDMYVGDEAIVRKGIRGTKTIQDIFETKKGIRTDKLLSSSVISETAPSDEIIHYGTKAIEGEEIITRTEITPFNIIEEVDPNLYEGEIVTKVEGQNGEFTYYDYYRTIKGTKELAAFKSEAKEIKPKIDKVVRIGTKQIEGEIIEKSSEKIPFGMIIEEDNSLFEDERVVIREGVPGIVDVVATYKTSKGEKIGEPINVQSFIQREAVDELVKVGTKPLNTTSKVENLNEIPFTVVKEYDNSLEEGVEKIIKVGKNGQKKIIVTTNYVRGIQDGESIVEEITIEEPQNQVILVGTKTLQKESPSPNNDNTDSQTKIDIPSSDDNLPKVPKIPNNTQSDIEKPIEKETKDSSEINQKGSSQTDVNKSKTTTKLDSNTTNNTNGSKLPETGETLVSPLLIIISSIFCLFTSLGMIIWKGRKSND